MNPKHILLVEDSVPDAELIQHALEATDPPCHFTVLRDGDEAIRFLLREPPHRNAAQPDLVLLDLNMPGTDGREVLHAVRQHPSLAGIPVIALTTSDSPNDVDEAYRLHANSYITKPSGYEAFSKAMRCLHEYWFKVATIPRPQPGPSG